MTSGKFSSILQFNRVLKLVAVGALLFLPTQGLAQQNDNASKASQGKSASGKSQASNEQSQNGANNSQAASNQSSTQSDNQNSSKDAGNSKAPDKPNTASELKNLNAAKANISALLNSNSSSNIGKIQSYKIASTATLEASKEQETAQAELEDVTTTWVEQKSQLDTFRSTYTARPPEEIKADLESLDPNSDTYQADLQKLEAEKIEYNAFVIEENKLVEILNNTVSIFKSTEDELAQAEANYSLKLEQEKQILSESLEAESLSDQALFDLRKMLGL
tara:strand:- start:191 stop:1021 length:831 start_codon:yes stop_codon:yes gene_type:complete